MAGARGRGRMPDERVRKLLDAGGGRVFWWEFMDQIHQIELGGPVDDLAVQVHEWPEAICQIVVKLLNIDGGLVPSVVSLWHDRPPTPTILLQWRRAGAAGGWVSQGEATLLEYRHDAQTPTGLPLAIEQPGHLVAALEACTDLRSVVEVVCDQASIAVDDDNGSPAPPHWQDRLDLDAAGGDADEA